MRGVEHVSDERMTDEERLARFVAVLDFAEEFPTAHRPKAPLPDMSQLWAGARERWKRRGRNA